MEGSTGLDLTRKRCAVEGIPLSETRLQSELSWKKGTSGNTHHNVSDRRPRRRTSRDVITTSVIAHLHTDVSLTMKLNEVFVIFTVMCEQQEGLDSSFANSAEGEIADSVQASRSSAAARVRKREVSGL